MNGLEGKVAIVTGGCGDIGRAAASRLCADGATVVLSDILSQDEGQSVAADIAGNCGQACYVVCDVSDRAQVDKAIEEVHSQFGRVDAVIANAGIVDNVPFLEIPLEVWERHLQVNLTGGFNVGQAAARIMATQPPDERGLRGKIIFTGSWVAERPWPKAASYVSSKSGLKMLAMSMALELAPYGIRVNTIAPGLVLAGLTRQVYERDPEFRTQASRAIPVGEFQTVEQVAAGLAFLCGADSDYMTGGVLLMDGGCSLGQFA